MIKKYWWALVVLLIAILIPFILEYYIRKQVVTGYEDTWIASVASYWGGIIGGMISGIVACIGVVATIRYYKESDAKKERAAIMPFFKVWKEELNIDNDYIYLPRDIEKAQAGKASCIIAVQNIGNGFAQVEDVRCRNDLTESIVGKTITKEQGMHLYLLIKDPNHVDEMIDIHFRDVCGNKYVQTLHVCNEKGEIQLSNDYPQIER